MIVKFFWNLLIVGSSEADLKRVLHFFTLKLDCSEHLILPILSNCISSIFLPLFQLSLPLRAHFFRISYLRGLAAGPTLHPRENNAPINCAIFAEIINKGKTATGLFICFSENENGFVEFSFQVNIVMIFYDFS